jgi:23S rRNA (uracil1939-C5)-methyltransferase
VSGGPAGTGGQSLHITLDGVAHGGEAVGRAGDLVTFVSLGLPGECVAAEVVERKPRFLRARTIEVVTPSPERVTPPCPVFGTCGGCHWQHASYEAQLRFKSDVLRDQLRRVGRFEDPPVGAPLPSPLQWHYRNRVQLVPVPGTRLVGFRKAHSHEPIPVEHCYISDQRINEVIAAAPWSDLSDRDWSRLEEIDVRVAPGQEPLVTLIGHGRSLPARTLRYDLAGCVFDVPAGAFFQVNLGAAERLVETALEWLAPSPDDHVVDAYGGAGTFAVPLAKRARRVTLIEAEGAAVQAAPRNAAANGVANVKAIASTVERGLATLRTGVDLLLLDPPRRGCGPNVAREIVRLRPERIVYVSCEPSTLARDLRVLCDGGYTLARTRMVDMFPQTYHLEAISLLLRD